MTGLALIGLWILFIISAWLTAKDKPRTDLDRQRERERMREERRRLPRR